MFRVRRRAQRYIYGMPHSYNVITKHADFKEYIALKHLVQIQGYLTDVYLPVKGGYDPKTRTGSVYNSKDHEYRYNDTPDFQARIAYTDPQTDMFDHGNVMDVNYTNIAYTLRTLPPDIEMPGPGQYRPKSVSKYCPGDIAQFSKLYVRHGMHDLSYFVREVTVLRNPNAKSPEDNALIRLELVIHV